MIRVHNTKFVCTLGPASENPEIIDKLIAQGMDVARLNFSHGDHAEHERIIKTIRKCAKRMGGHVAILQDLQGPKIRIGKLPDEGIKIKKNQTIILSTENKINHQSKTVTIPVQYKDLHKDVKPKYLVLIDDGTIELRVQKITGRKIHCKVLNAGIIRKNKGINVPQGTITANPITKKDLKDLAHGLKHNIDFVALSFVKEAKDVKKIRDFIKKHKKDVQIIAKIEREEAVENLKEILEVADGLMVARGDLAMEVGPEKVPVIQRKMIKMCNEVGKPVITATQMLSSMVTNPVPTRAEVSDIANAIFDHSDAIMLSNETAVGEYPVRALSMFAKVSREVEKEQSKHKDLLDFRNKEEMPREVLYHEFCKGAERFQAEQIVIATESGFAARQVSKYRTYIPTIVITPNKKTVQHLLLSWGLNKFIIGKVKKKTYLDDVKELLKKEKVYKKGKKTVLLYSSETENYITII